MDLDHKQTYSMDQVGTTIVPQTGSIGTKGSIKFSSDGTILAIGSFMDSPNAGRITIYQNSGQSWNQMGLSLNPENSNENYGFSIDLSSNGMIIAGGAMHVPCYDLNGNSLTSCGKVRIYQYSGGTWNEYGNPLTGSSLAQAFGYSVSLSSDGSFLAVGSMNNSAPGMVQVYQYTTEWNQIGNNIVGTMNSDMFGASVALSFDGSRIVIGAPRYNSWLGRVKVYEWNGFSWDLIGSWMIKNFELL